LGHEGEILIAPEAVPIPAPAPAHPFDDNGRAGTRPD
jgi:hypothetical protein